MGKEKQLINVVRIKVNKEASDYINGCEKITIDEQGKDYTVLSVVRPHGLIDLDYFTYFLQSVI